MAVASPAAPPAAAPAPAPRRRLPPDGAIRTTLREAGDLAVFVGQAMRAMPGAVRYLSETLRQAAILVRGTTPVVMVMSVFMGITIANYFYYLLRSLGASDFLPVGIGYITTRAAGPLIFGYVIAAKVGSGIVAEVGSMRINEELDALESEGVDPRRYVVATRIGAALLFAPIAVTACLLAEQAGAYLDAVLVLQVVSDSGFQYHNWAIQGLSDYVFAFICLGSTAIAIVIVSCYYGFKASGGPAGVGAAAAQSLVVNLVLVHVITGLAAAIWYGMEASVPLGG